VGGGGVAGGVLDNFDLVSGTNEHLRRYVLLA
jgi:hypothetical protein